DSLRKVYRFTSSLAFHVSLLRDGEASNVNIVDLVTLEALRVFEPETYAILARSKDALTGQDWAAPHSSDRDVMADILPSVPTPQKQRLGRVIQHLFPLTKPGVVASERS